MAVAASGMHRRAFGASLVAAGLGAAAARAAIVDMGRDASGIRVYPDPGEIGPVYTPPTDLKTVLDIYKRMTGPVTINGSGPHAFVADTGANQSVISTELAAELKLPAGDPQPLNSVAGVLSTPTVTAKLQVGGRPANDASLFVLPADAIGGTGMLGLDQLDGGRLTLDFQRQMLTIDAGVYLPGEGIEYELKAHRRDGQLTLVDADVAGIKVTAFLDSGAQNSIGNMALRELARTRYPATQWTTLPIVSVTGQTIDAAFAELPGLRIGGLSLPNWPVAFADLHTFRLWDLVGQPAILIGVDVMSRFQTICLDFKRDQVRFRLPTRYQTT